MIWKKNRHFRSSGIFPKSQQTDIKQAQGKTGRVTTSIIQCQKLREFVRIECSSTEIIFLGNYWNQPKNGFTLFAILHLYKFCFCLKMINGKKFPTKINDFTKISFTKIVKLFPLQKLFIFLMKIISSQKLFDNLVCLKKIICSSWNQNFTTDVYDRGLVS